jgi:hypothetical protein
VCHQGNRGSGEQVRGSLSVVHGCHVDQGRRRCASAIRAAGKRTVA